MAQLLFSTKLYIPQLRPNLIKRTRLTSKLGGGQTAYTRLTLVIAPAGFGKSTLLSEWAEQAAFPVAWLSLDQNDNDPARFFAYLAAALQQAINQTLFEKDELPNAENLLEKLTATFSSQTLEVGLVLDDYHLLDNPDIHDFMAALLDYVPPGLHLLIASRSEPPLPLNRLRGRGQLLELGVAELGFTDEESATFLSQTMNLKLPPELVRLLEERTEGWPAGLQLAALSLQNQPDLMSAQLTQNFTGRNRYILDYLAEEVLRQQPAELKEFLLATAHLEKLTASLCQAVTGRADSQLLLEKLEQLNLFLIPLDNERHWYRYHHLFADFLRTHQNLQTLPERHLAASLWYEQNNFVIEALDHAAAGQAFEQIGRLLEKNSQLLLMQGELKLLSGWLGQLPPEVYQHFPALLVTCGWTYTLQGQIKRAEQCLGQAEILYQQKGLQLTELLALRAILAAFHLNIPLLTKISEQALESLIEQDNYFLRSLVVWGKSFVHFISGEMEIAIKSLQEAAQLAQMVGNTLVIIQCYCHLAEIKLGQGQLREAEILYKQAIQVAQPKFSQRQTQSAFAGQPWLGLAEIQREWGLLEQAEINARKGIGLSEPSSNLLAFDGWLCLTRIKQGHGQYAEALELLDQIEELFGSSDFESLHTLFGTYRVRLWLRVGKLGAAQAWLKQSLANLTGELGYPYWAEYTSRVRVWIAGGQHEIAADFLGQMRERATLGNWQGSLLEVKLLEALNLQAQGHLPQAVEIIEEALWQAETQNYIRLFADEGAAVAKLLTEALNFRRAKLKNSPKVNLASEEYILKLVQLAGEPSPPTLVADKPSAGFNLASTFSLSEQELKVLRLLAAGLSNPEIAGELVIATSTVKTHVLHIFSKLEVRNRMQAGERARELGLL